MASCVRSDIWEDYPRFFPKLDNISLETHSLWLLVYQVSFKLFGYGLAYAAEHLPDEVEIPFIQPITEKLWEEVGAMAISIIILNPKTLFNFVLL